MKQQFQRVIRKSSANSAKASPIAYWSEDSSSWGEEDTPHLWQGGHRFGKTRVSEARRFCMKAETLVTTRSRIIMEKKSVPKDGLKAQVPDKLTGFKKRSWQMVYSGVQKQTCQVSEISCKLIHMYTQNIVLISHFLMTFISICWIVKLVFSFLFHFFGVC